MNFLCPLFVKCLFWRVILSHFSLKHIIAHLFQLLCLAACCVSYLRSFAVWYSDNAVDLLWISSWIFENITIDHAENLGEWRPWFVGLIRQFRWNFQHFHCHQRRSKWIWTKSRAVRRVTCHAVRLICLCAQAQRGSRSWGKCANVGGCLNLRNTSFSFLHFKRFYCSAIKTTSQCLGKLMKVCNFQLRYRKTSDWVEVSK